MRLKVCCIASRAEASLAIGAGANAVGLVSAMPSGPGVIDDARIAEIAATVAPPHESWLLTSRTRADAIAAQHATCRTSAIQLVDTLDHADEYQALRARLPGVTLVQVIHVVDGAALDEAHAAAPLVDRLLLDSGNPRLAVKELGGTGRVHDWTVSAAIVRAVGRPTWLAGGLTAGNVREAIAAVRPHGIDVCSGVRVHGRLDAARLAALVAAIGTDG